jgi:hypothetical protein
MYHRRHCLVAAQLGPKGRCGLLMMEKEGQLLLKTRVGPCIVGLLLGFLVGQSFLLPVADDDELGLAISMLEASKRFRLDRTRSWIQGTSCCFLQQFHLTLHHHAFASIHFRLSEAKACEGSLLHHVRNVIHSELEPPRSF